MKKLLLIGFLLTEALLTLPAQVLPEGQSLLFQPEENRTRAQVGFRFRQEDEAYTPAEGKGLLQGEFAATARHSLDSTRRVAGSVSYERGVKQAVNWNTSSDWELLAPYHTLDTVGGDLQREQYRFAARYASRPGRFFYSLQGKYRALHEFRSVDPRPRNVTADLEVSAQAGLLFPGYALSLEGGYRTYHQRNNVQFLSPRGNNTSLLHYLGFGRYSTRFSGAKSSTAIRFQGNGFSLQGMLEPRDGLGWIAGGSYDYLSFTRYLPEFNETPLSRLLHQEARLYAGHKWSCAFLRADARYHLKQGFENIVDASSAFLTVGSLPMLREQAWEGSVSGLKVWKGPVTEWSLQPIVRYKGSLMQGLYPGAEVSYQYLEARAAGATTFPVGGWNFRFGLSAGGRVCLSSSLDVEKVQAEERFLEYFSYMHSRRRAHALQLGADARIAHPIGEDLALYLRPEIAYTQFFIDKHHRLDAFLALGIEF